MVKRDYGVHGPRITWWGYCMMIEIYGEVTIFMADSRHPNTSVTTTKVDQLITVTTQAGITTQDRRLGLGITSSPNGPTDCNYERLHGATGWSTPVMKLGIVRLVPCKPL